jgi:hypothetical protein
MSLTPEQNKELAETFRKVLLEGLRGTEEATSLAAAYHSAINRGLVTIASVIKIMLDEAQGGSIKNKA